jgi:hypothetical protein
MIVPYFLLTVIALLFFSSIFWSIRAYFRWRHKRRGNTDISTYKAALTLIGLVGAGVLAVNLFFSAPDWNDPHKKVYHGQLRNISELERAGYFELTQQETFNFEYHYRLLKTHFDIPYRQKNSEGYVKIRADDKFKKHYQNKTEHTNDSVQDVGHFGLGVFHYYDENYHKSLDHLQQIQYQWPYVNYFKGVLALVLDKEKPQSYFIKEVKQEGYLDGTIPYLDQLMDDSEKQEILFPLPENYKHQLSPSWQRVLA